VNVAAVNDAPVISATSTKTITVAEEGGADIIIDATDVDSATLTPSITKAPTNGTISVVNGKNAGRSFSPFRPLPGAMAMCCYWRGQFALRNIGGQMAAMAATGAP
jgi:hypothetical protein